MIIAVQAGRIGKLTDYEITSTVARDVAPRLAITIVAHDPLRLHTDIQGTSWGQLPRERAATTVVAALSNWLPKLGGVIRFMELLSADDQAPQVIKGDDRRQFLDHLVEEMAGAVAASTTKVEVGLSSLHPRVGPKELAELLPRLKERLRQREIKARIVLPRPGEPELSAKGVRHNKLTTNGYELVILPASAEATAGQPADQLTANLGLTLAVYDPDRDARLDRGVPESDPRAGMLPPKLARMMVNIAAGPVSDGAGETGVTVMDPFCGHGRIILEAALLGYATIGRDFDGQKVTATKANLEWLRSIQPAGWTAPPAEFKVWDATKVAEAISKPHVIATETCLGPPLRWRATPDDAQRYKAKTLEVIRPAIIALLKNRPQRMVIAVPGWSLGRGSAVETQKEVLDVFQSNRYDAEWITRVARDDSFVARDIILAKAK